MSVSWEQLIGSESWNSATPERRKTASDLYFEKNVKTHPRYVGGTAEDKFGAFQRHQQLYEAAIAPGGETFAKSFAKGVGFVLSEFDRVALEAGLSPQFRYGAKPGESSAETYQRIQGIVSTH